MPEFDTLVVSQEIFENQTFKDMFQSTFPSKECLMISIGETSSSSTMLSQTETYLTTRQLIHSEGLLGGLRSGAVWHFAQKLVEQGKRVIAVLDDSARLYSDTLLNEDWLLDHDVVDPKAQHDLLIKFRGASVEDLQLPEAVSIFETQTVGEAMDIMISRDFSQLPVISKKRKIIGLVSLDKIQRDLYSKKITLNDQVSNGMVRFF
jgi:cystathionine beta-synthase